MSSQIKPVLVKDDVLAGISDSMFFAVNKSGQSISTQRFNATSVSSTNMAFTVNVPSTSVVVSREVLVHTRKTYTIKGVPAEGKYLVNIGLDAPSAFPIHSDIKNAQVQINNTVVSLTTQQMLQPLLRCCDKEALARWNSFTPSMLDNYGNYAVLKNYGTDIIQNSPLAGYGCATDAHILPRGCARLVNITGNNLGTAGGDVMTVVLTYDFTEPLMVSPFVWGDEENQGAGFYGITNINVNFNLDPTASRSFRWVGNAPVPAPQDYVSKYINAVAYEQSETWLECRFYTPHPSDLLPEVNVVPYAQYQNFQTTSTGTVASGETTLSIPSNNIQLNSIPDKVLIWIKDKDANLTNTDADGFCTIESVSINFNNQSNLLAGQTKFELWRMSQEAGLNMNWNEFDGVATMSVRQRLFGVAGEGNAPATGEPLPTYTPLVIGDGLNVPTCASVVVLDFGRHIQIQEDYYASGSVGQFNFQVVVNYKNRLQKTITPELNVAFMHSGLFVNQNGTSSVYASGVLSKAQVLDASAQEPILKSHLKRMVGGSFLSRLGNIAKSVLPMVAPMAKHLLSGVSHPVAQATTGALGALGYGKSGGAESGGRKMAHRLL